MKTTRFPQFVTRIFVGLVAALLLSSIVVRADYSVPAKMAWWYDARFGMFITITVPASAPNAMDSVVTMEMNGVPTPAVSSLALRSTNGTAPDHTGESSRILQDGASVGRRGD